MKRQKNIQTMSMIILAIVGIIIAFFIYNNTLIVQAITGFAIILLLYRLYFLPIEKVRDSKILAFEFSSPKIFLDIIHALFLSLVVGLALYQILALFLSPFGLGMPE